MISSRRINTPQGWTLVELVSVLLLLSILGYLMLDNLSPGPGYLRSDLTQQRLEAIRRGILGADAGATNEGVRRQFGFVGDIGRLPATLDELTQQGALPAWAFDSAAGAGAGWRGPYVSPGDSLANPVSEDAWGRPLIYSTTGPNVALASLGADGAAGGTSEDTDLVLQFPASEWRGNLSGQLRDGNAILATAVVSLRVPVGGALSTVVTTADANGYFRFDSVPFGVRGLRVLAPVTGNPVSAAVHKAETSLPDSLLNLRGGSEGLSVVAGSEKIYDTGATVVLHLKSTYSYSVQVASLVVTWGAGGTLDRVVVNGIGEAISPGTASGATTPIAATMVIPANSTNNSLELRFSASVSGQAFTVQFGWLNRVTTSTISFTAP